MSGAPVKKKKVWLRADLVSQYTSKSNVGGSRGPSPSASRRSSTGETANSSGDGDGGEDTRSINSISSAVLEASPNPATEPTTAAEHFEGASKEPTTSQTNTARATAAEESAELEPVETNESDEEEKTSVDKNEQTPPLFAPGPENVEQERGKDSEEVAAIERTASETELRGDALLSLPERTSRTVADNEDLNSSSHRSNSGDEDDALLNKEEQSSENSEDAPSVEDSDADDPKNFNDSDDSEEGSPLKQSHTKYYSVESLPNSDGEMPKGDDKDRGQAVSPTNGYVRSRTILVFDSDDEDESSNHIKEYTIVEKVDNDEIDPIDELNELISSRVGFESARNSLIPPDLGGDEVDGSLKTILSTANAAKKPSLPVIASSPLSALFPKLHVEASSEQDLVEVLPNKKLSVFICTWNMAEGKYARKDDVRRLLFPESLDRIPDMYVIGTQESVSDQKEWEIRIQQALGTSHVLVYSASLGVIYLAIFIKRELMWYLSLFEDFHHQTRAAKQIKTKGAVGVAFCFFGTSFLFLTSHFTPHAHRNPDRIHNFNTTLRSLANNLPHKLPARGSTRSGVCDKFDYVFWFGDFNFRIEKLSDLDIRLKIKNFLQSNDHSHLNDLLENDQLNMSRKKGECFGEFTEEKITFIPSYKFDLMSDAYDSSRKNRSPSYTDRILYYTKYHKSGLSCKFYESCMGMNTSDHKPVISLFEAPVEPIPDHADIPLGSNLFNQEVYLTALNRSRNRRSQNTANQSNVCSLQ